MNNKFTNFIDPFLDYIDSGKLFRKPFDILYLVFAILNLLLPLFILYTGIKNDIFSTNFKFTITFILIWISIVAASWIGFQIWWNRRTKLNFSSNPEDEFVATPSFSHFIQTAGEWAGSWIAIVGTAVALFTTVFMGSDSYYLTNMLGIPFLSSGFIFIILMPIYGFLIVIVFRFIAEQIRALTSIANNTKKIKEVEEAEELNQAVKAL